MNPELKELKKKDPDKYVEELERLSDRLESHAEFLRSKNGQKHSMCRELTNKLYDVEERCIKNLDLLWEEVERLDKENKKEEAQIVFDLYQKIGSMLIAGEKNENDD